MAEPGVKPRLPDSNAWASGHTASRSSPRGRQGGQVTRLDPRRCSPLWDGQAEVKVQVGDGHQSWACGFGCRAWCIETAARGSGGNLGHISSHWQAEGSWGFGGGFGLAYFLGGKGEATPRGYMQRISRLSRPMPLLSRKDKAIPVAHEDMGGHIFVPLLLCLLGTLILSRPVQEHLNLHVCACLVD